MKQHIRIAIAQINPTVGDIRGNAAKILDYAFQAKQAGASLMLTPELALCGYPPEDLLMRQDFNQACAEALTALAKALPEITLVLGHPAQENNLCFNAASVLQGGRIISTYFNNYQPFCVWQVRWWI
jgi:predicted amidohydrolase